MCFCGRVTATDDPCDTGSSDLWVIADSPLKLTNDSGLTGAISYGKGFVEGPIQFAELRL